jgi:hypothetical protein
MVNKIISLKGDTMSDVHTSRLRIETHEGPHGEEEMTYVTEVIRRLKALLLLGGALDTNYRAAAARTLAAAPVASP